MAAHPSRDAPAALLRMRRTFHRSSADTRPRSAVTQHRSKTVNRLVNVLTQTRAAHGGPRLPPDPRIDGPHLSGVRLGEVTSYEAQVLIPYISHGPLIFWLYPVFGIRAPLVSGRFRLADRDATVPRFSDKRLRILGALGSTATFIMTVTIIPFMPTRSRPVAGLTAMRRRRFRYLVEGISLLLAASIYLLKQDVTRRRAAPRAIAPPRCNPVSSSARRSFIERGPSNLKGVLHGEVPYDEEPRRPQEKRT